MDFGIERLRKSYIKTQYIKNNNMICVNCWVVLPLQNCCEQGLIDEYIRVTLIDMSKKVISSLFADGRTSDAELAAKDEEARKQFYREYGMID